MVRILSTFLILAAACALHQCTIHSDNSLSTASIASAQQFDATDYSLDETSGYQASPKLNDIAQANDSEDNEEETEEATADDSEPTDDEEEVETSKTPKEDDTADNDDEAQTVKPHAKTGPIHKLQAVNKQLPVAHKGASKSHPKTKAQKAQFDAEQAHETANQVNASLGLLLGRNAVRGCQVNLNGQKVEIGSILKSGSDGIHSDAAALADYCGLAENVFETVKQLDPEIVSQLHALREKTVAGFTHWRHDIRDKYRVWKSRKHWFNTDDRGRLITSDASKDNKQPKALLVTTTTVQSKVVPIPTATSTEKDQVKTAPKGDTKDKAASESHDAQAKDHNKSKQDDEDEDADNDVPHSPSGPASQQQQQEFDDQMTDEEMEKQMESDPEGIKELQRDGTQGGQEEDQDDEELLAPTGNAKDKSNPIHAVDLDIKAAASAPILAKSETIKVSVPIAISSQSSADKGKKDKESETKGLGSQVETTTITVQPLHEQSTAPASKTVDPTKKAV